MNPKTLEDIAERVVKALPKDLSRLGDEISGGLRRAVSAALEKADLVTREEFDVQSAVLARSREKLEALETKLDALERELKTREQNGPT